MSETFLANPSARVFVQTDCTFVMQNISLGIKWIFVHSRWNFWQLTVLMDVVISCPRALDLCTRADPIYWIKFFSSVMRTTHCYHIFTPLINVEHILSPQDDVQSTPAESPPTFKPPPPPGVQRHPSRREQLNKCPSSESSHSGLYFTAPTSHNHSREPGHPNASPSLHHRHPRDPSRDYAAVRKRDTTVPSKKEQITAAQLSMVTQHNIGPFPRVQSPSRGTKPAAPSPSPPPPPPLPAPPPPPSLPLKPVSMSKASAASSPGSKQQFVTVEVHRPNAEPDVNEVRPLPQARGEDCRALTFIKGHIWVIIVVPKLKI